MIKEILKNLAKRPPNPLSIEKIIEMHRAESGGESPFLMNTGRKVDPVFGRSLRIRQVDAGSCNACEWECTALLNPIYDIQRFGVDIAASPRHADMLLVTGPASRQMELALKKTYNATPEPRLVIACGDCAFDGGIYKGSYAVTNGIADIVPVDFYIKGCPPSPARIIAGIMEFMRAVAGK